MTIASAPLGIARRRDDAGLAANLQHHIELALAGSTLLASRASLGHATTTQIECAEARADADDDWRASPILARDRR